MYALHDLICRDARVLNRHAGKMYGFIPGVVTQLDDKQQKRHQRGYVKVCFPGLQDTPVPKKGGGLEPAAGGSSDPMINPWARLITPNAGGMIESKKTKKEKRRQPTWTRTPRQVPFEIDVETEEPIFEEVEEVTETDKPPKLEPFQETVKGDSFKHSRPWQGEGYSTAIWESGGGEADCKAKCKKTVAAIQKALEKVIAGKIKILLDGHTDTSGWSGDGSENHSNSFDGNLNLAKRRIEVVRNFVVEALNEAGPDVAARVQIDVQPHGEAMAGEIRDKKSPSNWTAVPGANPKSKTTRLKGGPGVQDAACRRCDITLDYNELKFKKEKKTTKKKVQIGVKKTLKKVKGQRTVYDLKCEIKEVEIEVPVPGKPSGTGFYSPPQIGDEVLCAFEQGDMHFPYIMGSLWNGKAKLPEPTTPGDEKRDKKGPQTKSMKGDSLCGGGGKNKIGYFKSRTGNLISLDDNNGVVRVQDRGGMSTVQLSKGKIEIIQSSGNIWLFADQKIRIDCKDMIVNAQENVWQHATKDYGVKAGKNQSIEAKGTWAITSKGGKATEGVKGIKFKTGTDMKIGADKMITITGKGSHNQGGAGVSLQALGGDLGITSKDDKCEVEAKGNIKIASLMKAAFGADSDLSIKADGMIDMSGLMNVKWKGSEALLNAGGSPPGALTLGAIVGAIIRGAKALAGRIAAGAAGAAKAVAAAAQKAGAAAARAAGAARSALGKIVGAVSKAVNAAAQAVGNAAKAVGNAARAAAQQVAKAAQAAVNAARAAGQAVVGMAQKAAQAARGAAQQVAQAAQQAVSAVGAAAERVAQQARQAAQQMAQQIRDAGQAAIDGARHAAQQAQQAAQAAAQMVQQGAQAFQRGVQQAVGAVRDAGQAAVGAVRDGVQAMQQAGERAVQGVQNAANQFKEGVQNVANQAGEALGNAAAEARQMAADAAGQALQGAGQALQGAGQAMQNAGQGMQNAGGGAGQAAQQAGQAAGQGAGQPAQAEAHEGVDVVLTPSAGGPIPVPWPNLPNQAGPGGAPMFDRWGNPAPAHAGGGALQAQ